uniref:Uncharacterized protein n=1 Tax=Macrostomum lignano TaxID=282301 RepID=A0A1I8I1H2_9PLAT
MASSLFELDGRRVRL